MSRHLHAIAGRCTVTRSDADGGERVRHGDVVVLRKPDDTVLVHDADGYQPVDWLTRADGVAVEGDVLTAWSDRTTLRVSVDERYGGGTFPGGRAGEPVGACPTCGGRLTRAAGAVTCRACDSRYGLPDDATVLEDDCPDCGLPRFRVVRGEPFEVCLDRACESLDDRVAEAFDRAWDCPDCGDDLRVLRRGGLLLGCASYPACGRSFSFPAGEVVDTCDCGLPVFRTAGGVRCLDADCEADVAG